MNGTKRPDMKYTNYSREIVDVKCSFCGKNCSQRDADPAYNLCGIQIILCTEHTLNM